MTVIFKTELVQFDEALLDEEVENFETRSFWAWLFERFFSVEEPEGILL